MAVAITLISLITGFVLERTAGFLSLAAWTAYAVSYVFGGYFGLRAGVATLVERKIDIDLLMVLAAIGAAIVGAPFEGALLLFLFSLSNVLQDYALDRTRSAIRALSELRPDTAIILEHASDRTGRELPVRDVPVGAIMQLKPGGRVPLDGTVMQGQSSVDQSSVTGESLPVEKGVGDAVLAGTMNQNGELICEVTKSADHSTIAKVIGLVESAQENKAKTARFLETFEQYYAAFVILFTVAVWAVPFYFFGESFNSSFYRAMTVMVAASPCALIISTPASILSAIGNGARRGLLFKGGVHVEQSGGLKVIAFDKTGTLTRGRPEVHEIQLVATDEGNAGRDTADSVLALAAGLESASEHVIAASICEQARTRGLTFPAVSQFENIPGVGISGSIDGEIYLVGSPSLLRTGIDAKEEAEIAELVADLQDRQHTVVVVSRGTRDAHRVIGLIGLKDQIRPESARIVRELKAEGILRVVMLTGDNERTAEAIAAEAGVDEVFCELLPEDKLTVIERLEREYGPTAMIGDGVNDAPALAAASVGVAMGAAGTDVALETADVVLLSDDLEMVPYLVSLSRKTRQTLVVNLTAAMSLIALMLAGIFFFALPLPLAVIGHEGGTVLVSLNGLRLLAYRRRRRRGSSTDAVTRSGLRAPSPDGAVPRARVCVRRNQDSVR
ncbi:MAG: heavy metal translocating P-type ATPase [Spirochaetaceae bacterium]|nr:MAG: heavy metal translocating P-type ATPase [Spirochaetaceae bacterium]